MEKFEKQLIPYVVRAFLQSIFQCDHCGSCCQFCKKISVDNKDVRLLAKHLKVSTKKAYKEYTHLDYQIIRHLNHNGSCCFYDEVKKGCKVYDARPRTCRTYPFMTPEQAIQGIGVKIYRDCPGMLKTVQIAIDKGFIVSLPEGFAFNFEAIDQYIKAHPDLEPKMKEQMKFQGMSVREDLVYALKLKKMSAKQQASFINQTQYQGAGDKLLTGENLAELVNQGIKEAA